MPHTAFAIEQHGAGAGGALIQSEQEFFWHVSL
jgi:hypothetical protein